MRPTLPLTLLALSLAACANAPVQPGAPAAKALTTQEVIDASTPADWRPLDPENTVYMQLPSGMVVMELAPAFAPEHTANIRPMVKGRYFDGLSINRSHDNFVVQWGDPADGGDVEVELARRLAGDDVEFTAVAGVGRHRAAGADGAVTVGKPGLAGLGVARRGETLHEADLGRPAVRVGQGVEIQAFGGAAEFGRQ